MNGLNAFGLFARGRSGRAGLNRHHDAGRWSALALDPSAVASSQVVRREARVLGDAGKHARADLVTFVEREDVALTVLDQHPV
jgi:hypothetical protein